MFYSHSPLALQSAKHFTFLLLMLRMSILRVPHTCSARGVQKRALDPVELELQMTVNCLVGAGDGAWVGYESSQ